MFSKASLQQLKERVDLVELVGSYLPLKRTGHVYKGCCPFHQEKTPSFQIQKGAQHYHCFGCGAHGDAFSFMMHQAGLSFVDAARLLADRYQVVLEATQTQEDRERERALWVMQQAHLFFIWCFWNHPEAARARQYLEERGLGELFCRRFGLGYCPSSRHEMRDFLRAQRVRDEEMEKLGLIHASRYDFFSERIIFPIANYRSQVIAFSARKYREVTFGGKYINTPETPLFKKSKTLFGLPFVRARIARERRVIVVEGQLDTLRMIEAGFNFTVAALGTAFGAEHVEQLKKLGIESVWLLFDADSAGREAAAKVGHLFMREGIEVKVASLDEGDDPDSALSRQEGRTYIADRLDRANPFIDFLARYRSQGRMIRSPAAKSALIEELKRQIEQWPQPLMVYEGLRALAHALCVPEALVLGTRAAVRKVAAQRLPKESTGGGSIQSWLKSYSSLEADLLRWILAMGSSCPPLVPYCARYLQSSDFSTSVLAQLWQAALAYHERGQPLDFSTALLELEGELASCVEELGQRRIDTQKMAQHVQQTVQELLRRRILQQAEQLRLEIQSGCLSDQQALEKAQEYAALRQGVPQVPPLLISND